MMYNKEQMIKPEQDSKVEKPHLLLPLNRKRKKTQNLHNTLQSFDELLYTQPGASTPYKRWSKCTMEKVGGTFFSEI